MKIYFTFFFILILFAGNLFAQSVLDPTDTIANYNSSVPPTQPPYGQIGKWVRTPRLSWNTSEYKCYIYKGCAFRLLFPKSYNPTANDGKKYPMMVFFHGLGETGSIYDNEYSLYHGGDVFNAAVDNGTFDGYVFIMQSQGFWGGNQYTYTKEIIDYMIANNKLDPFAVSDNGLSAGGQATWEMLLTYPNYIASAIPMSQVDISYKDADTVNEVKFTPIWNIQGGLDGAPAPSTAHQVRDAMLAAGGNYRYTEYPNLGHDTWDQTWTEPDFYPFMLRAYASNPWPLTGRTAFCPNDTINVIMGVAPGFDQYQWMFNNTIIDTATHNTLQALQPGTYSARVLRNGLWSDWSHTPVVITIKAPTVTPPIQVSGLMSTAIPAADGKNYVNLQVPNNNYVSYSWKQVGSDSIVGTQQIYKATQPGYYIVSVTEQYGCSSNYSPAFKVINAKGSNAPSPSTSLVATTKSNTKIQLAWQKNPHPINPQTAFEIYRGSKSGGPYTFIGQVSKDSVNYTDSNLIPNTKSFYVVRAIDSTAASALSNEVNTTTFSDKIAPSIPNNLRLVYTTPTTISIAWDSSTDNVSVDHYVIFLNGIQSNITKQTSFILTGLNQGQSYAIYVKAVDGSNNYSAQSAQINAAPILGGLRYKFYTTPTQWNVLPNFSTLTPVSTGISQNTDISVTTQSTNFGFVWQGYIRVPVAGTYTIETSSDDGSDLWFNSYTPTGTPFINNDGLHGTQSVGNTITLQAGIYPICAEYFQGGGGVSMSLSWSCTQLYGDNNQHTITNNYFADTYTSSGNSPAQPTVIKATAKSYNAINVAWTDNSNNESGFEIYRGSSMYGPFSIIYTTGANITSFTDSSLNPSSTYFYKVQAINQFGVSGFDPLSISGITYNYYQGSVNNTVQLTALTPISSGIINNISLSPATATSYFGFKYAGAIHIPTSGQYTFYTSSDDGSDLYIGGFDSAHLVVKNDYFQGNTERSGSINLSAGTYPLYVTYFQGGGAYILTTSWQGPGISKSIIPDSAFLNTQSSATTLPAPALPAAPTFLKAKVNSSSQLTLSWKETDATVTGFNFYVSPDDSLHFQLLTTLPKTTLKYTDTALFGNKQYYFKVSAIAPQGTSNYSTTIVATTKNDSPVITDISNMAVHYGITTVININATDVDGDSLSFSIKNKPSFATLIDNHNNTSTLTIYPKTSSLQGTYNGISIIVKDTHKGADTTTFNLTVNSNYVPVMDTIKNYTLNENDTLSIPLSAHDQNTTDTLNWSATGLPKTFALTNISNGKAILFLHPNYASAGIYTPQVTVSDGHGGVTVRQFTIIVNDIDPNTKIYVRFLNKDSIGSPWNSITSQNTSNLLDTYNKVTKVGLAIQGTWFNTFNAGATTGNNSGIYPDAVLEDYFYFGIYGAPNTINTKVTGLDTSRLYNLTFFGSSIWAGASNNGATIYSVGSQSDTLNVQNNTQNTVSINQVKPAVDGTITFTMSEGANTPAGYLNALIISSLYDDGTRPVSPTSLTAQNVSGGVLLAWNDVAYNETGYQIYRSLAKATSYTLVGQTQADATSYTDTSVSGNTQYYYKIDAYNAHGASIFTTPIGIITLDRIPKIAGINDVILKNNTQASVNITATDDPSDHITLSVSGLPSFATFTDNGNGTGKINIAPQPNVIGTYPITVKATDNSDSSSSVSFNIIVTDQNVSSVYLNFSDGLQVAPKPWNNLSGYPFAGTTFNNLKDDGNNLTNISVQFTNGFQGVVESGMQPENGEGIYPNSVLRAAEFESSTNTDTIKITGLDASKKYNFVFFNSHDDGLNGLTNFTINSQTVSLNATDNISKTVQINGITADANGNVIIGVSKDASANYAFITSLIIQSYDSTIANLAPTDLRVTAATRSTINLQWADRSYNETGYEVWRATDSTGNYTLLASLPAVTTSYADAGLSSNTTYYYAVRAVFGSDYSNYSNAIAATTYAYSVYINCTTNNDAGIPWNNTDAIPQVGYTWNNFFDETGVLTSTGMQLTNNWAGDYTAGVNPGNNSGIFPDTVMVDSYGLFPGQTGMLQITGLNLGMKYNFTFFASSQAYGDVNVAYTINGVTAILNASLNVNGTVTIYGVTPDNNGNVNINVSAATLTSQFGLLGAFIMNGYTPSSNAVPQPLAPSGLKHLPNKKSNNYSNVIAKQSSLKSSTEKLISVYPNPFHDYFTLSIQGEKNNTAIEVMMFDINGKLVYNNQFIENEGMNNFKIETNKNLASGVYIVKIINSITKSYKSISLVKQ